jgi:hypothetical protein
MVKKRILRMLEAKASEKKQKALTSLQLLMDNPVGIGDHSTDDFYENVESAFQMLIDADDMLNTLKTYDWDKMDEIN